MSFVYLDWNATTPPHPDVVAAMAETARAAWANPSSLHRAGRAARAVVEDAREAIAALIGLSPRDAVLTSGGTEANNLALVRPFRTAPAGARGTCVTSRLEHPSITAVAEQLAQEGVDVVWLPPPPSGLIEPARVEEALARAAPGPRLVAVQAVNHETGVIQPVADIAAIAHRLGAELHVDAVQAAGRLPPDTWRGADSVTVSAHKIRGPKGVGALLVRPGVAVVPILRGGAQEKGLRPGTVDPIAVAGFGVAARRAAAGPAQYAALVTLRDELEQRLMAFVPGAPSPVRNGDGPRAPHVANLSFPGWVSDELVAALDLEGVCVSAGSACAAGTPEPSPVLTAMLGEDRARSAVRISLGEETARADLDRALEAFARVLSRARRPG